MGMCGDVHVREYACAQLGASFSPDVRVSTGTSLGFHASAVFGVGPRASAETNVCTWLRAHTSRLVTQCNERLRRLGCAKRFRRGCPVSRRTAPGSPSPGFARSCGTCEPRSKRLFPARGKNLGTSVSKAAIRLRQGEPHASGTLLANARAAPGARGARHVRSNTATRNLLTRGSPGTRLILTPHDATPDGAG